MDFASKRLLLNMGGVPYLENTPQVAMNVGFRFLTPSLGNAEMLHFDGPRLQYSFPTLSTPRSQAFGVQLSCFSGLEPPLDFPWRSCDSSGCDYVTTTTAKVRFFLPAET